MRRKNFKNKAVAAILSTAMLTGLLSGCGASESTKQDTGAQAETEADEMTQSRPDSAAAETESTAEEAENAASDMEGEAEEAPTEKWDASTEMSQGMTADSLTGEEAINEYEASKYAYDDTYSYEEWEANTEEYDKAEENGFCLTVSQPLSTFSANVDTASYANVRRMIEDGYSIGEIDPEAVRAEEFINYFSYRLQEPGKDEKFGVTTEMSTCPWNEDHKLLMVGMKTEEIDMDEAPDNNLVFLLDVSGSMDEENKLPLLQKSFKQLAEQLGKNDRVSIVTYANGVDTILEGAKGSDKEEICEAIDSLYAGGGTNGEDGIQRAYELAKANFIKEGNNRVILATDGDLNIGISDPEELSAFIEEKRDSGVFLSVLGFGDGNYKDNNMAALADSGNGNYSYIDSLFEAKKVLVEEMGATLVTVAKDVKLQVEFNPGTVNSYRLIGYENKMLDAADFKDDTKDAGEIGAGHTVVALYEIIPVGSRDEIKLKYQSESKQTRKADGDYGSEYATASVRYKEPTADKSKLVSYVVDTRDEVKHPSDDFVFASLVAEFAMILSDSPNKGTSDLDYIIETYQTLDTDDEYKDEFYYLVRRLAK